MANYGYQGPNYGYRPRPLKPMRPNDRAGALGAAPFPSLAAPRPDNRPGPLGANPIRPAAQRPVQPAGYGGQPPDDRTPAAAQQQPATPTPPPFAYDYSTDPILQKIRALGTQGRQDATTNATRLKKQALIDYGAKDLALDPSILGDQNTALAAEQNPYSVFGQLRKQYDTGANQLDEALNSDGNLFYSGHRIKQQGQLADNYQGAVAGATGELSGILGGIDQGRLAAFLGADQNDLQAESDASQRAIDTALASGYTFAGYGPDGKPILIPPDGGGGGAPPPTTTTDTPPTGTPPSGGEASSELGLAGASGLPVGATENALIYALLGRRTGKNDLSEFGF